MPSRPSPTMRPTTRCRHWSWRCGCPSNTTPTMPVPSCPISSATTLTKHARPPPTRLYKSEICETILRSIREHCERIREKMTKMVKEPTSSDQVLTTLMGISLESRADELYKVPTETLISALAGTLFDFKSNWGSFKTTFPIYNKTLLGFVAICEDYNLNILPQITGCVVRMYSSLITPPPTHNRWTNAPNPIAKKFIADRKELFRSESLTTCAIDTLSAFMTKLMKRQLKRQAWTVMRCLYDINKIFMTSENVDRQTYVKGQMSIASLLWDIQKYTHHAFCLYSAVALDNVKRGVLLSQCILATLCCEDTTQYDDEAEGDSDMNDVFDENASSRQYILAQVKQAVATYHSTVDQKVLRFMENLLDPNFDNFQSLSADLTEIVNSNPSLQIYEKNLRKTLIERQLTGTAERNSRISADSFSQDGSPLPDAVFISTLDDIARSENVSVEVDCHSRSVFLLNSTKDKIVSSLVKLSTKLQNPPPASSSSKLNITLSDLAEASQRSVDIRSLAETSFRSLEDRQKKRVDEENAAKEEKKLQRKREEEEKREKIKNREYAKLKSKYNERVRQERALLVLKDLRANYPGFKLDDSIALHSDPNVLEDVITPLLADYLRNRNATEIRERTKFNLIERVLLQLEMPKREAYNREHADARKAEVAASRANYLAHHREEYDKRLQEKEALSKFLKDAEAYEKKTAYPIGKTSKRDAQEQLLEMEKQRLEENQE
ncbi:hypothetical protein AGDE_09153 [Angomonas deanei]|uniref:Uncharacterized protein n=1 Tax=Angomonas deanei TaxID=59799 RepID=A0A7G2CRK9_9TRYP|nr:hypothetical protein AGDE_09153 [Angomonas deanei]CAD2221787.1 hypothetical protein, conserved [Angomonas deanei]|eukprot:EPY31239.1 hypothetical protein AGDE_09153 [Angomonas deanei]